MNNETKKDLIIGVLIGLITPLKPFMEPHARKTYESALEIINEIYYPDKENS